MENEIIKRNWKEFVITPPLSKSAAYASINSEGRIFIDRKVWGMLKEARHVSLLYDTAGRTIGIRPSSHLMPNALTVTIEKRGRIYIRAKHFTKAAHIDISYCLRFLEPHLEGDILILDLNRTARAR